MSREEEREKGLKEMRSRSRGEELRISIPEDAAQEPLPVGSKERTLLPQTYLLKSRRWQQKPPVEGPWGQVTVF